MEILSVKKAKELTIDTEVKPCPFVVKQRTL